MPAIIKNMGNPGRPASKGITEWSQFFDAVDETRRGRSFHALKRLFYRSRRTRERALINATARALAWEMGLDAPWWASLPRFLSRPFFVAGVENLKASALVESPMAFRQNNIFVLANFLKRV